MTTTDRVRDLVEPVCTADSVDLVDVELNGGVLRLTVDRDGGLDLDAIASVTRRVSRLLDEDDPVPGRYTLEVTSPGLERKLRTPDHFRRAVGDEVTIRTVARGDAPRRLRGTLVAADDEAITVGEAADGVDEVAAGVNKTLLNDLAANIERMNHELGYTFFVIEHDMDLIGRLCDPVIVMAQGSVIAQGPMAELRACPSVWPRR